MPEVVRRNLVNPLVQRLPESVSGVHGLRRLREFAAGSLLDPVDMYAHWIGYYTPAERHTLYSGYLATALSGRYAYEYIRNLARDCDAPDPVSRAMYVDCMSFLPNNVLHYGDRMSMAHALEVRVPLADPKLLEYMLAVPGTLKLRRGKSKYLLRRLLSGKLPPEVCKRRKTGFNPPMGVWLNGPLREVVETLLSRENLRRDGFFNPEAVARMLEAHRSGRRDYTWHLWALIMFEQWRKGA